MASSPLCRPGSLWLAILLSSLSLVTSSDPGTISSFLQDPGQEPSQWFVESALISSQYFTEFKTLLKSEPDLNFKPDPKISSINCNKLEQLLPSSTSSVYFTLNPNQIEIIKIQKCTINSSINLKAVVSFSLYFINSDIRENFYLQNDLELIKNFIGKTKETQKVSICKGGYFDFDEGYCVGYERKLTQDQEQELIYLYGNFSQFYEVPTTVTLLAAVNMTHDFFVFLTSELRKYTFGYSNISGNVFTVSDYESVHDAIISLLSSGLNNSISLSIPEWNSAFSISEIVFSLSDPASFALQSQIKFTELTYYYLKYFKKLDFGSCPSSPDSNFQKDSTFPLAVASTFDFLSKAFIQVYQGGKGPEGSNITEKFPINSVDSIQIMIKFMYSDALSCTCGFCAEDKSIVIFEAKFSGFGYLADLIGVRGYEVGFLNEVEFTYPVPAVVAGYAGKCFEFYPSLHLESRFNGAARVKLHKDLTGHYSVNAVVRFKDNFGALELAYNEFGVFAPAPVCSQGKNLDSGLACIGCKSGCVCECPGECDDCFFNFEFDQVGRNCETCSVGYGTEDCSACAVGFVNVGSGLNCSECAEGFRSSSLVKTLCDICEIGFQDSPTLKCGQCSEGFKDSDSGRCSVCDEGFIDSENEKCGKCYEGFVDFGGKKCSVCDIGFQDSNGKKCSGCLPQFEDFNGKRCIKCVENFKDDEVTGLRCSICAEGFRNDVDSTECSICDIGFKDDEATGKRCSVCSIGFSDSPNGSRCSVCSEGFADNSLTLSKCSICAEGFIDEGSSRCSTCDYNFENDSNGKKCSQCRKGYKTTSTSPSKCNTCDTGYKSSNPSKAICDQCSSGYGKTSDNSCAPCKSNCLCSTSDQCDSCIEGYILIGSSCGEGFKYLSSEDIVSANLDASFSSAEILINKIFNINFDGKSCSYFFSNSEVLGTNSRCSLKYSNTLFISLGLDFTLTNETVLTFTTNVKVIKTNWVISPTSVTITYKVEPLVYSIIQGPQSASLACGADTAVLEFLASSSYGALKYRFEYVWRIETQSSTISVQTLSATNQEKVVVEASSDQLDYFLIYLNVSNKIYYSITFINVSISNSKSISFKLDSGSGSSFKRGSDISISPQITDVCGCVGKLTYAWTVLSTSTSTTVVGLVLTNSRLRIGKNSLDYGDFLVSLNINCGSSLSGTSSATITISYSDLVIKTNKGNQDISSESPLSIDGSSSYDPDGYSLQFSWSYLSYTSSGAVITIQNSIFQDLESLTVTLTVSTTQGSRSSTLSLDFQVLKTAVPTISILGPSTKVSLSSSVVLKAATSEKSALALLTWSQLSGPPAVFFFQKTSLWFEAKTFIGGSAYTFSFSVALGPLSASASAAVTFTVNKEPVCSGGFKLSPTGSYSKSTKFTFRLEGCADGDNQDLPLTYKFYMIRSTGLVSLLIVSSSSVISSISLPVGVVAVRMDACDSLVDCVKFEKPCEIKALVRELKGNEDEMRFDYLNYKMIYDTIPAVVLVLSAGDVGLLLFDEMWKDFKEFCDLEILGESLLSQIASTIELFMLQEYADRVVQEALVYLNGKVVQLERIGDESFEFIFKVAEISCGFDRIEGVGLAGIDLIESALERYEVAGNDKVFTKCVESLNFSGLGKDFLNGFINYVEIEKIDSCVENKEIDFRVSVFYSNYSEIIVKSKLVLQEIIEDKVGFYLSLKRNVDLGESPKCESINDGNKKCKVSISDILDLKIYIEANQTFRISGHESESSSNESKYIELYAVFSLVLISLFAMPIFAYIDHKLKADYFKSEIINPTVKSERSMTICKEEENNILPQKFLSQYLIFSLFTFDPLISKLSKFSWLISVIICEIIIQILLLQFTQTSTIVSGIFSVIISCPISYLYLCILLKKELGYSNEFWISLSSLVFMLVGLEVTYFLGNLENWFEAFIAGTLTEIFISQPFLAVLRRISFNS